jgi:hypothetical protein
MEPGKNCISLFALSELLRAAFVSGRDAREPAGQCDESAPLWRPRLMMQRMEALERINKF